MNPELTTRITRLVRWLAERADPSSVRSIRSDTDDGVSRPIGPQRPPVTSSESQAAGLVRHARTILADQAGEELDQQHRSGTGGVLVNVTVYVHQRLRASMPGRGATLDDAVRDAAARAAADVRFGPPLSADDLTDARVELWIQTGNEVIDRVDDIGVVVDLGLHGITMIRDGASAYYEPSLALTRDLARHDLLLDALTMEARLPPGAWRDPRTTLQRTWWEHYCEVPADPDRVLHLRRLRPAALEELTPAGLRARVRLAADRLLAVQSADGYYLYRFHPFKNQEESGPGNLVRQAGCAYALARAADAAEDSERRSLLAASAGRVLDALLGRIVVEGGTVFIEDLPKAGKPVRGKLGTIALTLAAVQSPSLAGRYETERTRLVEAILACQRADGSFRCTAGQHLRGRRWQEPGLLPR